MRTPIVALDLETTGLDVERDTVIEVGAVMLHNGQIVREFSTLINPGTPIPPDATYITGIRQEDLRGKPTLREAKPELEAFIGDAPIVAHNAAFDMAFMRRVGLFRANYVLDTLEMASILLPQMPRYGLGSLAAALGIVMDTEHRALADARATAHLYWHLWQHTLTLPASILTEIASAGAALNWSLVDYFSQAAHDEAFSPAPLRDLPPAADFHLPLRLHDETTPVDPASAAALLASGSALAQGLPSFEARVEQQTMAAAVMSAFNEDQHLIVEAGTGTGKSLAYLIPAALWTQHNQQRVVIATNTINLQDQLIAKDIPLVNAALPAPVTASVMKGRGNYLCPRRLEAVRRRRPTSLDDVRILAKILVWLQGSQSGDRGEINLRAGEWNTWARLSAEDEGCHTSQCETLMNGTCPFYRARRLAESSQIVIVNHALLASDAKTENHVLPDFDYLVIDEAHQLEDAVTSSETTRLEMPALLRRVAELGDAQKGLLSDILRLVSPHLQEKGRARLQDFALGIGSASREIASLTRRFYSVLIDWAQNGRSQFTGPQRVTEQQRRSPGFAPLQDAAGQLADYLLTIAEAMNNLAGYLDRQRNHPIEHFEDLFASVTTTADYFQATRDQINEFALQPMAGHIYWVDINTNPDYHALMIAPLNVGPLLDATVWTRKRSVVVTSATLETNGSFEFIQKRLNLPHACTLRIGSPFDYQQSTLLFLPVDMHEPTQPAYQKAVERAIIDLATALNGRTLVLFTSYTHLRETASSVGPRLALGGITLYDQASGGSRESLLEGYRSNARAVLMGTRSFWQGVDLPGTELEALVIVRLPFAVPSDPVFAARAELYDNGFDEYAVPDAIIRFRQGFGRLIRSSRDRGIVAVLDSRITRKKYGARFLEALPDCTVVNDTVASIADHALRWLRNSR